MKRLTCLTCHSPNLVPDRSRTRSYCHACWNAIQRKAWAENREARLIASRANYRKHAARRRAEAAVYKASRPEYYALAEWFRRKGISITHLDPEDLQALIDMKRAVRASKNFLLSSHP
jgi:transcription initiation factor TFIIIB Brf1 subunit/transcription initiation factor TFIIB